MAQKAPGSFTLLGFCCACKELSGSIEVPTAALPLPLFLCHCNTCRFVSGLLCVTIVTVPAESRNFQVQGSARSYNTSKELTRYFCENCGTSVYETGPSGETVSGLCTGALSSVEGVVQVDQSIFVADTKDGGLSSWLPSVKMWEGWHEKSTEILPGSAFSPSASDKQVVQSGEKLHCRCHCKGVEFDITPPTEKSSEPSARLSDSILPYHQEAPKDHHEKKWWLRANRKKYHAALCVCDSCRLASGYDIQAWAFIPEVNLQQVDGRPIDFAMGTLKQRNSSKGRYRHFCGTCGATVFWRSDGRPGLIDVSVGLMEAASGARAEEWLVWATTRISFQELAQNKPLTKALGVGLEEWGRNRSK